MRGVPNAPGPSLTLGLLGPSHQWCHKSWASLRGPPCAHGVAGTPQGEVRDNLGHRERPPRGGSPRTRLLPDRHQSGPGDHQVRFHRNHCQGSSNRRIDRSKDRSGGTSLSPASHEDSGKLGINTNQWRRRWSRSAPSLG